MFLYIYREENTKQKEKEIRMARILISMPEKFLDEIDGVAKHESRSRSELIREALRSYIQKNRIRENALSQKNAQILEELLK